MREPTSCTVVVPCYNEAARFQAAAFKDFLAKSGGISFVLVNDGSTDNTLAVLEDLRRRCAGNVEILNQPQNAGKAEAVRTGMLHALATGAPDLLGFWDADLATPLSAIVDLSSVLASRPETQMVFGSRVQLLGRDVRRQPARHYLGRVFATTVSVLLRLPIYDTQCGAKLFRVTPELPLLFGDPFITRWLFDVEILARFLRLRGFDRNKVRNCIYEYPLHEWRDVAGSKVRPTDFIRAFIDLIRIQRKYLS